MRFLQPVSIICAISPECAGEILPVKQSGIFQIVQTRKFHRFGGTRLLRKEMFSALLNG